MMEQDDAAYWRGRVVALEEFMIGFILMAAAQQGGDPATNIRSWQTGMFASLQHGEWEPTPENDAIYAEAVESMKRLFVRAMKRI